MSDAQTWTIIAGFLAILATMAGLVLRIVATEVRGLRGEFRGDMSALRSEFTGDMSALRGELRGEMTGLRGEMNARFNAVDRRFDELERDVQALSRRVFGIDSK